MASRDFYHHRYCSKLSKIHQNINCPELPTLHYLERTSESILHAAHYYMDGKGAVTLMHDFLSELSELSSTISDREIYHLPRIESAAIGIFPSSKGLLDGLFSDSVPPKELIGISHCNNPSPPGASAVFKLRFSLAETERIAKAVKLYGVSITHFVHTALILAAKHQGKFAQGMNYSTLVSTDLRNLCRGPHHTGSRAVNL